VTGLVDPASTLATAVLPNQLPGRWAEFAFGMLAAEAYASGRLQRWSRFVPAMMVAAVILVPVAIFASRLEGHIVYGVLFATLVCIVVASDNPVSRILAWRPLVILGTMSYSLYLIHQPVLQSLSLWIEQEQPGVSPTSLFLMLLASIPAVLLLAWLLFLTVERRTMGPSGAGALQPRIDFSPMRRLLPRRVPTPEPRVLE
jgi:peptidoglycan/LPS O-acetylase OafA/YrhL